MDIQLPSGQVLKGVPDGTTKEQLSQKLASNGIKLDAPKATVEPEVSAGRTMLDKSAHGATFGFGDDAMNMIGAGISHVMTGMPFHDALDEASQMTKERMENESKQHPALSTASEIGGAIASPATLAGGAALKALPGAGMLANVVKGALGGAAGGALSGAGNNPGNRMQSAAKGALTGGALGGAVPGVTGTIGKAVAPQLDKAVNVLREAGVKLTPGQLSTKGIEFLKRAEGALGSIPLVGSSVRSAVKNSIDSFNHAVLNKALAPIGEKMPKDIEAGRGAIAHAERTIGDKYDKLLPKLTFKPDAQLMQDYSQFRNTALGRMSKDDAEHFDRIVSSIFNGRVDKSMKMSGTIFKDIQSELSYEQRKILNSGGKSVGETNVAEALGKLQGMLTDNLERMNPSYAKELRNINSAWAMFKRAQEASARRPTGNGVFSPSDLSQSIKKASSTGSFARGDGLLQELSDAANQVLPNTVPDSGTPERALWAAMLGGAAKLSPKTAITGAALSAPYTKPGINLINKAVSPAGPTRQLIRQALEKPRPGLSVAAGQAGNN